MVDLGTEIRKTSSINLKFNQQCCAFSKTAYSAFFKETKEKEQTVYLVTEERKTPFPPVRHLLASRKPSATSHVANAPGTRKNITLRLGFPRLYHIKNFVFTNLFTQKLSEMPAGITFIDRQK